MKDIARTVARSVGPSYADVREQRIAAQKHRKIDIVVCVHNALDDVRLCLESVRHARNSADHTLIIIDDGSDQLTARYLEDFASNASWIELHRNAHARGYTKAANQGLAASAGDLVILLNSDTIVTDGWAEKMADAVFSTPGAGIVGPMSSAASHQSIPEHRSSKGQTAINDLPPGVTAEDMSRYCEQWTAAHVLPRVPLVHGFCFGLTREAINRVGLFDEDNFPKGYGEENDYCFRATDAGFGLVIATHTYVFHAKSKSYAGPKRVALMKAGSEALRRLHGCGRIQRSVRSMQENPIFVDLRQRARGLTKGGAQPNELITSSSAGGGLNEYDFVDFGCSTGGSIIFARDGLGGRRGLGLDVNPKKVEATLAAGFDAKVADVTILDPADIGTVRFVVMSHFLEHLPDGKLAQACIDSACSIADEFVFIRQPYFDADDYLSSLGLKLYWSDWTGHPYHMTSLELHSKLSRLLEEGKISRFLIVFRSEIKDSRDPAIHPLSSLKDQHQWDPKVHDRKPDHKFNFPVYYETGAIVLMKQNVLGGRIKKYLRSCFIDFDSADGAANH